MTITNREEDMIKFRLKYKSYSREDDEILKDPSMRIVVNKLDKNNVYNYGLSKYVPNDVISINYGKNNICTVNIPLSLNEFQYDIEDFFLDRKPRIRYSSLTNRNSIKYISRDKLNENTIYDLVLHIIDRIGYVILCPESKSI